MLENKLNDLGKDVGEDRREILPDLPGVSSEQVNQIPEVDSSTVSQMDNQAENGPMQTETRVEGSQEEYSGGPLREQFQVMRMGG